MKKLLLLFAALVLSVVVSGCVSIEYDNAGGFPSLDFSRVFFALFLILGCGLVALALYLSENKKRQKRLKTPPPMPERESSKQEEEKIQPGKEN